MVKPKVGAKVVAVRDIWDPFAKVEIPKGTAGVIVGVGPDAAFGFAAVTFDWPGATPGYLIQVTGYDSPVSIEVPAA